jgi:flagellar protein FlbD
VIEVTRLNGVLVMVNAELIKFIEATPDTLITLTTGEKIMVKEPVDLVAQRVLHYRQQVEVESGADLQNRSSWASGWPVDCAAGGQGHDPYPSDDSCAD